MSWFRNASRSAVGVLVLAATFAPARASAEEPEWLVSEVDVGRQPATFASAVNVGDSLRRHGQVVIAGSAAAKQFAREQSRSPVQLQSAEIEQFDRRLRALADHLASENLYDARLVMAELSDNSPDTLDYLNRQAERARRRYHGCLLMGQLLSKAGQEHESSEQLTSCARDFPGFEPERSPYLPESIRAYFERVLQKLRAMPASLLRVEIARARDDEPDDQRCHALINGIDKGAIPATVANIRADVVRVQVECGDGPARIHEVVLKPGKNTLAIDPTFDGAVQTQGSLKLSYENPVRASQLVLDHSLAVATAVGVQQMVLVMNGDLLRVDVATRRISARASLSSGTLDAVVGRLVEEGPTLGEVPAQGGGVAAAAGPASAAAMLAAEPTPSDLEATEKRAAPARDEGSGSHVPYATLGWISAGGAVAAGATALIAWRVREGHAQDFNTYDDKVCTMISDDPPPMCAASLKNVETAETVTLVAGIVGGSLAVASAVFFLLDSGSSSDARAQHGCGAGPGDLGVACKLRF
jgi:hypothetical protein